ncbi:cytochrome P450 [Acetobacter fallax]|uniref:Cytochrome P450 n=1 Tax=Acetobacter fallax TaxID=1737473 RepID=A0ABX0KFI3_9PROT|nr:cytochrome P450 [Acetobacter fallax]NHO33873.1 cytochrome P450 [Acetobacter fallax]NHO37445.1 cytochrome P450 [Acetobacter fallax]
MSVSEPFIPPMPSLPSESMGGLGVLIRLRRNGFSAFPQRCFVDSVVPLKALGRPLVLACGPEAMKAVLSVQSDEFQRLKMGRRVLSPIVGEGILVSEGDIWKRRRRAMAPAFTPRMVPTLARHIAVCAAEAVGRLPADGLVNVFAFTQRLALDIAAVTMFSMTSEPFGLALRTMVTDFMTGIGQPRPSDFLLPLRMPTVPGWRRHRFRRRWVALVEAIITEREEMPAGDVPRDLFDLLVRAFGDEAGVSSGEAAPNQVMIDEVATMIVAGHETTATALFWACLMLARVPEWQEEVAREVSDVDLSPDHAAASLSALPVTTAVMREVLRLFPPAFMTGREAERDTELCGVPVRRGSMLLLPFWMLHRRPELWRDPDGFDPRRFLDGDEPDRFAFLPFGAGPHVCIGAQLAMTEAVLVLARLVQGFRFSVREDVPVVPVGVLSTRPGGEAVFRFETRKEAWSV